MATTNNDELRAIEKEFRGRTLEACRHIAGLRAEIARLRARVEEARVEGCRAGILGVHALLSKKGPYVTAWECLEEIRALADKEPKCDD